MRHGPGGQASAIFALNCEYKVNTIKTNSYKLVVINSALACSRRGRAGFSPASDSEREALTSRGECGYRAMRVGRPPVMPAGPASPEGLMLAINGIGKNNWTAFGELNINDNHFYLISEQVMAKSAVFGLVHILTAFGVTYALTGDLAVSGAVTFVEPLVNTVVHYFFDKAWHARAEAGAAAAA